MAGRWAEAHIKIARMTLTIKLDRNWSSFQLANSAPPLSVTDSAIAPSARMVRKRHAVSTPAHWRKLARLPRGAPALLRGRTAKLPSKALCPLTV